MSGTLPARRWEALILAAGASRRMGFPKALLFWEGRPLLAYLLHELLATRISRVLVVLGADAERIWQEVQGTPTPHGRQRSIGGDERVCKLINPSWQEGKSTSIQTGAKELSPSATDLLILSVDQPVRAEVVEALMGAHERLGKGVTLPVYGEKRGHPVALAAKYRQELSSLSEESQGLRELIRRLEGQGELAHYAMSAPCIHWNFNRPGDVIPTRGWGVWGK